MSIEALESQTQYKHNCFSVKAKFKSVFRQTFGLVAEKLRSVEFETPRLIKVTFN